MEPKRRLNTRHTKATFSTQFHSLCKNLTWQLFFKIITSLYWLFAWARCFVVDIVLLG